MPPKLVYVANARMPTEKAHGLQIAKMCEAFAILGADVVLVHPARRQDDRRLRTSVQEYYSVRPIFDVRVVPNVDITPLSRSLPLNAFMAVFLAHAMLWASYAARIARRARADAYFTRDLPVAFWLVRLGLPTVYEAHAIPHRLQRGILSRVAPALRGAIGLTNATAHALEAFGVRADRLQVLPDAVDLELFTNVPDRARCRERLAIPRDRAVIGYVGRFQTLGNEKGLPELIHAFARVRSRIGGDPLLLCVGGPLDAAVPYRELMRRLGLPESSVRFVDRVPNADVPCWLRACDVATLPFPDTEHYARFASPMKLFEYMAAGVPIVATDLPALREILRPGDNALMAAPGDAGAFADALCEALRDPGRAGALAARARADVERHTWLRRAEQALHAFQRPSEA